MNITKRIYKNLGDQEITYPLNCTSLLIGLGVDVKSHEKFYQDPKVNRYLLGSSPTLLHDVEVVYVNNIIVGAGTTNRVMILPDYVELVNKVVSPITDGIPVYYSFLSGSVLRIMELRSEIYALS